MNLLLVVQYLAECLIVTWTYCGASIDGARWLGREPHMWVRHVFYEIKPLYLPALVVSVVLDVVVHSELSPWRVPYIVICLLCWFLGKGIDDDDRWKRRRRRLMERVAEVAGRLTVIPQHGGA